MVRALTDYLESSNAFFVAMDAFEHARSEFKVRPQLAQDQLEPDGLSANERFQRQVHHLGALYRPLDRYYLQAAWYQLDDQELDFIQQSVLQRMHAEFSGFGPLRHVNFHKAQQHVRDSLTTDLPSGVELFSATTKDAQRIYALIDSGQGYTIKRVDRMRQRYEELLGKSKDQLSADDELLIQMRGTAIERKGSQIENLIEHIAAAHQKTFERSVHAAGFHQTTGEKVTDTLLSLVPFYTCISEATGDDPPAAAPACVSDLGTLMPLTGSIGAAGVRGSQQLARGGMLAARQAAAGQLAKLPLKVLLRHSAEAFFVHGVIPASRVVGKQELLQLGKNAVRTFDPGLELLGHFGKSTLRQVIRLGQQAQTTFPSLKNSLKRWQERAAQLPQPVVTSTLQGRLPGSRIRLPVVALGGDRYQGKSVMVPMSARTGVVGGPKFTLAEDGRLHLIPLPFARRLKNIFEQGLGGRGAPQQGQSWARETAPEQAPEQTEAHASGGAGIRQGMPPRHPGRYAPFTLAHFREWERMTPAQRRWPGRVQFSKRHNINFGAWERLTTIDEPFSSRGYAHIWRLEEYPRVPITAKHIIKWMGMTQAQRNEMGLIGFARAYYLHPVRWDEMVSLSGRPTSLGAQRLSVWFDPSEALLFSDKQPPIALHDGLGIADADQLPVLVAPTSAPIAGPSGTQRHSPEQTNRHSYQAEQPVAHQEPQGQPVTLIDINAAHLRQWQALSQLQREQLGIVGFANQQWLDAGLLASLIRMDGSVTSRGQKLFHQQRLQGGDTLPASI